MASGKLILKKRLPVVVPLHDVIVPDFDLVLKLVDDGRSGPAAVQTLQKNESFKLTNKRPRLQSHS